MATHNYHRLQQGAIPSMKPGSNWCWIRVDFSKQPGVATDTYRLMELKNHWVVKCGFYRVTTAGGTAGATFDVQTAAGANDCTAAIDIDGADTLTRFTAVDDDAPVAVTADGYLTGTLNTQPASSGITDLFVEIVVPHTDVDAVDSIAE